MRLLFFFLSMFLSMQLFAQVNLQNGVANYAIPIFSYSEAKSGLSTAVSLDYSSGNGLKVGERAANTGQNWALTYGGAIYRKQNGEPDDQNSTVAFPVMPNGNIRGFNAHIAIYDEDYQSANVVGDPYSRDYVDHYYPNGFMYSEFAVDIVDPNVDFSASLLAPKELALLPRFQSSMDKRYKQSRRALADREQDIFVYNFNGRTGEFVIGKDGSIVLLNDAKLVIQKNTADLTAQNIRTRINRFTIIDEQGIEYRFAAYEITEVLNPTEISIEGTNAFSKRTMRGEATGQYTIQKWLLTEIINPTTVENISFLYENYNTDVIITKTPTYQNTEGQVTETVQVLENRLKGQLKRIKTIGFPDGHQLEFFYNIGYLRPDVPEDNTLGKITLTYNAVEKYSYNLVYGYFMKKLVRDLSVTPNVNEQRFARLCLKSVSKSGVGLSEPSYKFSYYTGSESADIKDIVPPSDCLAQDHWGFYNKASIIDIDSANVSKETIRNLLVNSSSHRLPGLGAASLGLLKSVETPFGGTLRFDYEQNYSKDADNPSTTKTYGGVRVSKTILWDGVNTANDIITNYYYQNSDGTTSGWGYEDHNYLIEKEVEVWNAGNLEGYTNGGDIKTNITASIGKIALNYTVRTAAATAVSAFAPTLPNAVSKMIAPAIPLPHTVLFSLITQGMLKRLMILFNPTDFIHTNTYTFNSFQSQNPIGINYSRVEVVNSSVPGGTGKIVSEFSAPTNVRSEIPVLAMPYSPKKRFGYWKYNLPLKTKIYNQAGTLISETVNNYNVISNSITNTNNKSCKVEVVSAESAACFGYNNTGTTLPMGDYNWEYYYPISGRSELTSTTETKYSPSGITAQVSTTVTYNNDYLPKTITNTKSNGDVIIVKNYYANDYNNISTAIQEMKTRNMVATPISTETWLVKPNSNEYLIDATINEFTVLGNLEIRLDKVYKFESKTPLLKSVIGEQSPTALVRNNTYFKLKETMVYGNGGVLSETFTPSGKYATQLFDFLDKISVASVSNAHQDEVAYSSFETNVMGNWSYLLANLVSGEAVMGKKFFRFLASSSHTITKQWTSTKAARLSFWKKGAAPTVTHNSISLTAAKVIPNVETGWTYFEYYFTGSGTVSISNTSTMSNLDIDELRLYPKDARMATVGYDPTVGKISECDINNRILYYEHDALGRVIHIKDERKNILKKICYNFSGEPENCVNLSDNVPQWRDVGQTMCQQCISNGNYNSGVRLKFQRDANPSSPTFDTYQWVVDPSGTCPTPAEWVQTDVYCQQLQVPPYGNSGYQVIVKTDMNPCSPTYNQQQYEYVANAAACPPTVQCSPACNEPEYKCIDGVCVQGSWEIIRAIKVGRVGAQYWECTYAYCFPDGSTSTYTQMITSPTACVITCP